MRDENQTYLWMIQHHIEALVTLLDMNKQHEILNSEVAHDFIEYMSRQSDTIWEESIWKLVAEILSEEPKEKGENVFQFPPELRGPDS